MKQSRKFNNILDECLERLLVKGETIEQCLQSYPEPADELEPLLRTALVTKKASVIQLRPEFRTKARYQFRSALQEVEPKRRLPFLGRQQRWVTAVAVVLVLLLAGGSTVAVAGNSMPDEPLYQVKLATEQVHLALTPSALGKAELYARLADKRVTEIVYVANKGKPEQVKWVTQRLNSYLARIAVLAPAPVPSEEARGAQVRASSRAKLKVIVTHRAVNHPGALRAALETAPESAKPALRWAINESEASYKKALDALD